MTKTITITFNNQSVELTPNASGLYPINELYQVSGAHITKKPSQFYRGAKLHLALENKEIEVIHGNNGGTWVTELGAYKYAAWVSPEFETAVFECFKAVVNGDLDEATMIAQAVAKAYRDDAKEQYKEFSESVVETIRENTYSFSGKGFKVSFYLFNNVLWKYTKGKPLPKKDRPVSLRDTLVEAGDTEGAKKLAEGQIILTRLIAAKMDYETIKTIMNVK